METHTDIDALVRRHQAGLWRYCRMLGARPHEAEELAQDAFLVLLRKAFREREDRSTAAFLRKTARYLFLDRRRRGSGPLVSEGWLDAVDRQWQDEIEAERHAEFLDALAGCVESLQGRARDVVELFYRARLARGEVARRMGLRDNGVKTLLQRTRRVLRDCVEREVRR